MHAIYYIRCLASNEERIDYSNRRRKFLHGEKNKLAFCLPLSPLGVASCCFLLFPPLMALIEFTEYDVMRCLLRGSFGAIFGGDVCRLLCFDWVFVIAWPTRAESLLLLLLWKHPKNSLICVFILLLTFHGWFIVGAHSKMISLDLNVFTSIYIYIFIYEMHCSCRVAYILFVSLIQ